MNTMDEVIKLNFETVESLVRKIVPLSINNVKIQRSITPWVSNNSIQIVLQDADPDSNIGVSTQIKMPQTTPFITEDDREEYKKQVEKMAMSEIENALLQLTMLINSQDKEPEFKLKPFQKFFTLDINYKHQEVMYDYFHAGYMECGVIESNNCFTTKERAEDVLRKFKTLLLLERLYDIYCPNYKPDWGNRHEYKFRIYYDNNRKKWSYDCVSTAQTILAIYFPSEKIAQKVCDKLNKEEQDESNRIN